MSNDQAPRQMAAAARDHHTRAVERRQFHAVLTAGLLALCASTAPAHAQEVYPSKPVTMLVAFPPGGPADVIARAMQRSMANVLKQPVIIENLPGAGGALAVQRLLSRPADGYTLIMGSPNEAILAPLSNASAKYKPEELELIAPISSNPLVVMARSFSFRRSCCAWQPRQYSSTWTAASVATTPRAWRSNSVRPSSSSSSAICRVMTEGAVLSASAAPRIEPALKTSWKYRSRFWLISRMRHLA